jgi:hypothetical protein
VFRPAPSPTSQSRGLPKSEGSDAFSSLPLCVAGLVSPFPHAQVGTPTRQIQGGSPDGAKQEAERTSGMKGIIGPRIKAIWGIAIFSALLLTPPLNVTIANDSRCDDACERRAWRAYVEALKFCQLAEIQNPRLKCYEAAKAAYFRELEKCRGQAN